MPGHVNAALTAYAKLNCDGIAPAPHTGMEVGFSSLCIRKELTYRFVDDVVREVAALTPGPYFHVGGDEASSTDPAEYLAFMERVETIVRSHGKRMIGWEEVAKTKLRRTSVAQHWHDPAVAGARAPLDERVALEAGEHPRRGRRAHARRARELAHAQGRLGRDQRLEQVVLRERQLAVGSEAPARPARRAPEIVQRGGEGGHLAALGRRTGRHFVSRLTIMRG